jgi:hypothetical protein
VAGERRARDTDSQDRGRHRQGRLPAQGLPGVRRGLPGRVATIRGHVGGIRTSRPWDGTASIALTTRTTRW